MTDQPVTLEQSFGALINRASALYNRRLHRNFRAAGYDVTPEQWPVLVSLWRCDGRNQQDISTCTQKDKPSITRLIDALEKRGWAERRNCPNDRRANLVFLTAEGKAIRPDLEAAAERTLDETLEGVCPEGEAMLRKCLEIVVDNLSCED